MLNIRQKSINMNRHVLLGKLEQNLAVHTGEYLEALADYKTYIASHLGGALELVQTLDAAEAAKVVVEFKPPQDHRADYTDAIDMLNYSSDVDISLDHESFKAFVKNEWAWTNQFKTLAESYKSTPHAARN